MTGGRGVVVAGGVWHWQVVVWVGNFGAASQFCYVKVQGMWWHRRLNLNVVEV